MTDCACNGAEQQAAFMAGSVGNLLGGLLSGMMTRLD